MKIYRKSKKDNLYLRIYSAFAVNPEIKIILNKKNLLEKHDDDEEYWEFICQKIIRMDFLQNWEEIIEYLGKDKFNDCKKIKIFRKESKTQLKNNLHSRNKCYIYYQDSLDLRYRPIDLIKLRENTKLYKKFVNRYCYFKNFGLPDSETCADYNQADLWFTWFMDKYYDEYSLPLDNPTETDIKIHCEINKFINLDLEPKMDYDSIYQEYFRKFDIINY